MTQIYLRTAQFTEATKRRVCKSVVTLHQVGVMLDLEIVFFSPLPLNLLLILTWQVSFRFTSFSSSTFYSSLFSFHSLCCQLSWMNALTTMTVWHISWPVEGTGAFEEDVLSFVPVPTSAPVNNTCQEDYSPCTCRHLEFIDYVEVVWDGVLFPPVRPVLNSTNQWHPVLRFTFNFTSSNGLLSLAGFSSLIISKCLQSVFCTTCHVLTAKSTIGPR